VRVSAAALAGRRLIALRGRRSRARRRLALPSLTPRLRRRLIALIAVAVLLAGGYQFWLRDSSFVAVEEVTVTGLTTEDAERVRTALRAAGHTMTTLHVDRDVLDEAIAHYPVVRDLEVRPDFPHGLAIHVIEHHAAAVVELDGRRVAVAGDGTILRGLPVEGRLPSIEAGSGAGGDRLTDRAALGAALVAGAVPGPLRSRVESIGSRSGDGLVATLGDGPDLIFGDSSRARAKWIAASRVLADPEAEGATYIDVRLPDRPAVGGLPAETVAPVAPAGDVALGAAAGTPPTTPADPATAPPTGATTPGAAVPGAIPGAAAPASPSPTPAPAPAGTPGAAPQAPATEVGTPGPTGAGGVGAPSG
jgi:cell division protein FtsQ